MTGLAALGFCAWNLLLLLAVAGWRSHQTLLGGRRANSFDPAGKDGPGWYLRLIRVHANAYESAPWFLGLLLLALATGHTEVTDGTAIWALGARLGQGITHLASTRARFVIVRFGFLCLQVGLALAWVVGLVAALA